MKYPTICIVKYVSDYGDKFNGIDIAKWDNQHLTYSYLNNEVEDYCNFLKVRNTNELIMMIQSFVKPDEKYMINIEDLYYTSDYVFQAIFKSPIENNNNNIDYNNLIEGSNKLATLMLHENHIVEGDMILIKRNITNNEYDYEDMTFSDIVDIIRAQLIHQAILITPNNTISEQFYIYDSLEIKFSDTNLEHYRSHEYRFLDFRLFFNIDRNAEKIDENLNKIASIIFNKKIYGNCVISLCDNNDSTPKALDINNILINQIYTICLRNYLNNTDVDKKKYGRNINVNNRTMTDEQINTSHFFHNNFPEITLCPNFFYVVKKEYNDIIKHNFEPKPSDIDKYLENLTILNDIE
jgi:hypothetical protein